MSRQDVNWSIAYNATQDVYTVSYASTFSSLQWRVPISPSRPTRPSRLFYLSRRLRTIRQSYDLIDAPLPGAALEPDLLPPLPDCDQLK